MYISNLPPDIRYLRRFDVNRGLRTSPELLGQLPATIAPAGAVPSAGAPEAPKRRFMNLVNVAILGPAMIYSGVNAKAPALLGTGLAVAGGATILINLLEWVELGGPERLFGGRR